MLAAGTLPDAVFAANDMMALGCLYAFAQAGVHVPSDVALAGFDDIPLARFVHPSLTTMQVSIAELGDRAMSRLLQLMDGTSTDGTGTNRPGPAPDCSRFHHSAIRPLKPEAFLLF